MLCNICKRFAQLPLRFKVPLTSEENLVSSYELSMDLIFPDGKENHFLINNATHFPAPTFSGELGAK